MKRISVLSTICMLILAACTYDAPLTEEHTIPIDQALLGVWEEVPEGEEKNNAPDRIAVLRFSESQYLVHNFNGDSGLYFRGYAIEVEGVPAMQLQFLGDDDGPVDETAGERFSVVSYGIVNGVLVVSELNTNLVSSELKDSEAIREAFIAHKDNVDLFTDPTIYRKL